MAAKGKALNVRLSEAEATWIEDKAEENGISKSEVVRAMIRALAGDEAVAK